MVTLKDCIVSDYAYYAVLHYLDDTNHKDVYEKHWETYDEETKRPVFSVLDLSKEQFKYLFYKAFDYFKQNIKNK